MDIQPDHILLFYTWIDRVSPACSGQWTKFFDPQEIERFKNISLESKKREFIFSRALTRYVLSKISGISPEKFRFIFNRHGKPELKPGITRQNIRFSLSHAGNMVGLGVVLDHDLGVDVEDKKRRVNKGVAQRFFSPEEIRQVMPGDNPEASFQKEVFLAIWTLKESYIKARGRGLSIPLNSFGFTLKPPGFPGISFRDDEGTNSQDWSFFSFDLNASHKGAVAVHAPAAQGLCLKIHYCLPFKFIRYERHLIHPDQSSASR